MSIDALTDEDYAADVFGSGPINEKSAPVGAPSSSTSATARRDERACLVSSAKESTTPLRRSRRLLLKEKVLLTPDVLPHGKFSAAAVLHYRGRGNPSIRDLAALLQCRPSRVIDGQRIAAEQGWLTVKSGHDRKAPGAKHYPKNRYVVSDDANPYDGRGLFVQLALTPALGKSEAAWIVRAYYLREQMMTGAVQVPLGIAARLAGLSAAGEKKLQQRWIERGEMQRVRRADKHHPATYTISSAEHPPNLDRFQPDKRRLARITTALNNRIIVWGTRKQTTKIRGVTISRRIAYHLQHLAGAGTFEAREVLDLLEEADPVAYFEAERERHDAELELDDLLSA